MMLFIGRKDRKVAIYISQHGAPQITLQIVSLLYIHIDKCTQSNVL
jgi:hypothetical protein